MSENPSERPNSEPESDDSADTTGDLSKDEAKAENESIAPTTGKQTGDSTLNGLAKIVSDFCSLQKREIIRQENASRDAIEHAKIDKDAFVEYIREDEKTKRKHIATAFWAFVVVIAFVGGGLLMGAIWENQAIVNAIVEILKMLMVGVLAFLGGRWYEGKTKKDTSPS